MRHLKSNIARLLRMPMRSCIERLSAERLTPDEEGLKAMYKKLSRAVFWDDTLFAWKVVSWHSEAFGWRGGQLHDKMLLQCLRTVPDVCHAVYQNLEIKGSAELSLVLESCRSFDEARVFLREAAEQQTPLTEHCFAALIKISAADTAMAQRIFDSMAAHAVTPTAVSFTALMSAYLAACDYKGMCDVYTEIRASNPDPPPEVFLALLSAASAPDGLPLPIADEAFKEAMAKEHTHPNIYEAYHAALTHHGDTTRAAALWKTMVRLDKVRSTARVPHPWQK